MIILTLLDIFLIFFLFFTLNILVLYGADDTITATQSLTADQTLVSSGGNFELGFFRTTGNSFNYYIGMWYKKISPQTILWVANRDTPVPDKFSSQLKILDGNLVLLDGSGAIIWSTNITCPIASNSIVAVLRDDGNLVLVDRSASNWSGSEPIWESFDYPTHTFLPGAKHGYNKLTKRYHKLTSWKSHEDPGTGVYSHEIDPVGRQYVTKFNRTVSFWYSGAWNGMVFKNVPKTEVSVNYISNISLIDNENATYFTYSVYNVSYLPRLVLDISGQTKMFIWSESSQVWKLFWSYPKQRCESYASCGAFSICDENSNPNCNCLPGFIPNPGFASDFSTGCMRRADLDCGIRKKNGFLTISHVGLPESPQSVTAASVQECKWICLDNCSCTAYTYYDKGCLIWLGILVNLKKLDANDVIGKVIHVKISSSELSRAKNKVVVLGIFVGCVLGVLALSGLVWYVTMRRKMNPDRSIKVMDGSLVAFKYNDLKRATKNFSQKLGGGGFGSVFKGTLNNNSSYVIAVKRHEGINQGEKQFRAEVSTIGKIQHVNLVRLHGFCSDLKRKLLVYEYMPNGSLNSHLFNGNDSNVLQWEKRYQIALGIAKGLAYLHEKCRECIIHGDVKPENILLDAEFHPKLTDFGLAKMFGHEFSKVLTTIRGTRGYLAPEWISGVAITTKADVYSFGMMLFELVSGRRNTEISSDSEVEFFPTEAATVTVREGNILSLLDHRLDGIADVEEVRRICRVACWCVQDDKNLRPSMSQVVQILEGVLEVKLPHMPLTLQLLNENHDEHIYFFTDSSSSLN